MGLLGHDNSNFDYEIPCIYYEIFFIVEKALEPGIERKKKGKAMKSIAFPFFLDAPFQGFLLWHLLCIRDLMGEKKEGRPPFLFFY